MEGFRLYIAIFKDEYRRTTPTSQNILATRNSIMLYFSVFLATMGIALKWRSLPSIYYISLNQLKSVFRMPYPTELTIAEAKKKILFFSLFFLEK